MEQEKFQSIVKKIVILPLSVMGLFTIVSLVSFFFVYVNMTNQILDGNLNSVQISQNQLGYQLSQIDKAFWEYWDSNDSHKILSQIQPHTSRNKYAVAESVAANWMRTTVDIQQNLQGIMMYYKNINHFMFRGISNFEMHDYLRDRIESQTGSFNSWEIVKLHNHYYLINVYQQGNLQAAAWIPVSDLEQNLQLADKAYLGEVYFYDSQHVNTLKDPDANLIIQDGDRNGRSIKIGDMTYYHKITRDKDHSINMGILIPRQKIIASFPVAVRIIFILLILTLICVPTIISWLQKKIATPIKIMDDAMTIIGEGHMDYRINHLPPSKKYDEFDRLIIRFNEMMDEINELGFKLYESKIREQQIELKYISQQIRPHFILNALNIIYTYDVTEFDLVKKMVLHLTEYFRYIVNLRVNFLDLELEMHHVQNYLSIQKERYMDSFEYIVEWEIETASLLIPPLVIQTFVENSIKYALHTRDIVYIFVLASIEQGQLKIMIADTGNGYGEETLQRLNNFLETREHQEGLGVGIENVIERMDILYEQCESIRFRNALSGGAVVEIYLPTKPNETKTEESGEL